MKDDRTGKAKNERRVELKYCEGCGGLGVRECGGGQVYCDSCAHKMEELAVSRTGSGGALSRQTPLRPKLSRSPILPVGKRSQLDEAVVPQGKDFHEAEFDSGGFGESDSDDFGADEFDSDDFDCDDLDAMARSAGGAA